MSEPEFTSTYNPAEMWLALSNQREYCEKVRRRLATETDIVELFFVGCSARLLINAVRVDYSNERLVLEEASRLLAHVADIPYEQDFVQYILRDSHAVIFERSKKAKGSVNVDMLTDMGPDVVIIRQRVVNFMRMGMPSLQDSVPLE